jgi:glutamyl-tRNA reductase
MVMTGLCAINTGMQVAHRNNKHVHFDPVLLKEEEERKEENKVQYCPRSVYCFLGCNRAELTLTVACFFYPSSVSQKLLKMAAARKKATVVSIEQQFYLLLLFLRTF